MQKLIIIPIILAVGVIYFLGHPSTVQFGDSGELVTSSYHLLIAHPPGYPTFLLMQNIFLHFFPLGTIFAKASLFNIILSLIPLWLLSELMSSKVPKTYQLNFILTLAFSYLYWRYSVLPDVFILHAVFTSGFCYLYLNNSGRLSSRQLKLFIVLFFIGMTHHLTFIFMAPLLFHGILINRDLRSTLLGFTYGAFWFFLLYSCQLFIFQNHDFYSWGNLETFSDVIHHFLRLDYGLFKLAPHQHIPGSEVNQGSQSYFWSIFWQFLKNTLSNFFPLFLLFLPVLPSLKNKLLGWYRGQWRYQIPLTSITPTVILSLAFFLYVAIFFNLANINPQGEGREVVQRFFIMPQIIFIFLIAFILRKAQSKLFFRRWEQYPLFILPFSLFGLFNNFSANNFSKNTVIEDFAHNVLLMAKKDRPSFIMTTTDSEYFSLRYVQTVLQHRPDVLVISPPLLFHRWYYDKIHQRFPHFEFPTLKATQERRFDIDDDLILPNIERWDILALRNIKNQKLYNITFLNVGRRLEKGHGLNFDDQFSSQLQFRSRPRSGFYPMGQETWDIDHDLYFQYAYLDLAKGLHAYSQKNFKQAKQSFLQAYQKVPYALPPLQNLCLLDQKYCIYLPPSK